MIVGGALLLDRVANSHLHYKVNYHLRFEKTMPPYKVGKVNSSGFAKQTKQTRLVL